MPKGKKCQGEEGDSGPSHCEETGGKKKMVNPLFDKKKKDLRTSAMGRTSSFKEISLTSSDDSAASDYRGKGLSP